MGYKETYSRYYDAIEAALPTYLPQRDCPQQIVEDAMRYSLLGNGKRLRGVLVLCFAELCDGSIDAAMPLACAIEMVHAYSLIHDDLPCMDNDDLRRGRPTCHIKFGEATALLAGDGLLTKAFEIISGQDKLSQQQRLTAVGLLSKAAGTAGMIGGQTIDIANEGKEMDGKLLDYLHSLKTGTLIRAAVALGCCAGGCNAEFAKAADEYAAGLGLIFQITDDLLDVLSTTEELGKPVGSDAASSKTTYATLYGIDGSKKKLQELAQECRTAITSIPIDSTFLCDVVDMMVVRTK